MNNVYSDLHMNVLSDVKMPCTEYTSRSGNILEAMRLQTYRSIETKLANVFIVRAIQLTAISPYVLSLGLYQFEIVIMTSKENNENTKYSNE